MAGTVLPSKALHVYEDGFAPGAAAASYRPGRSATPEMSKNQAARVSALLFARAMRKQNQRLADKVAERINSQMTAATDSIVVLFITVVPRGSVRKSDGTGIFGR